MHWPGAGIFLIIGIPLPFILFLPFYIRYHNKIKAKSDKYFIGLFFFMIYMATISSFLALDPAREVYESYLPQINDLVIQTKALEQRNNLSYENITKKLENGSIKDHIELLKSSANDLCNVLEEAKKELIIKSNKNNKSFISSNKIDYNSLEGISKNNMSVSLANRKDDNTKENILEKKLISFENAVNNLSDNYEIKEVLFIKDKTYSLDLFRTNIYEEQLGSKTLVENLSAFSLMQNKLRFMEYQILYNIQN
jgi:hypothetical protein